MPKRTSKTGSELFIVDNSDDDWKVQRYLHDCCQLSKAIDVATGYFEIGGLLVTTSSPACPPSSRQSVQARSSAGSTRRTSSTPRPTSRTPGRKSSAPSPWSARPRKCRGVQQPGRCLRREGGLRQGGGGLHRSQPPRPLDYRTISLNGEKGGMLVIVDGQPRLVNSRTAWNEWTLRETGKGWTIQGRLSREKPEPRFLSVDAEGKATLVSELGDGAYWKLTRKGDRMNSFDATLQASGGKFDGWYLGFSDEVGQIERDRFKYKSYHPKLSKEAGPRTNLYIFIDGP